MPLSKYFSLSLLSLLISGYSYAEESDAQKKTTPERTAPSNNPALETLLVKGYASASSLDFDVSTKRDFLSGVGQDIADFAQAIPGLQVDSRSNYAQDTRVSFRGFGSRSAFGIRGIKLYEDGVPLSMPDGQGQLSSILLDRVETISAVKGPLAILYGAGAGGVIFIESNSIAESHASISAVVGEDGFRKKAVDLALVSEKLWGQIYYADIENQGVRAHSFAEREKWSIAGGMALFNQINFTFKHQVSKDPLLQDPLGLTPQEWREDPWQISSAADRMNTRKAIDNELTSMSADADFGSVTLRGALWRGERQVTQYLAIESTDVARNGGVVFFDRDFHGANIALSHELKFLDYVWINTLGAEWSWMEDDRKGFVNNRGVMGDLRRDEMNQVRAAEIYGVSQFYITPKLQIYGGLRASDMQYEVKDFYIVTGSDGRLLNPDDSGKKSFDFMGFAFGVKAALTQEWQMGLGFGRGHEAPTFSEMAYSNNNQGFNFGLNQATSDQWQWDLAYKVDDYDISLSVFHIESQDELVVDSSTGGRTTYRNAGETQRRGAELAATWRPSPKLSITGASGYIDAFLDNAHGDERRMPGVAAVQQHVELRYWPFGDQIFYTTLAGHHRSKVFISDDNAISAPSYVRWDAGVGGEISMGESHLNWWLKLRNLTDESYVGSVIVNQSNGRSFEPAPPKQIMMGVELRL